jgi:hypothetical protein
MKPGWQTSEFWITVAGQGLSLLTIAHVITAQTQTSLAGPITNAITAAFTLWASARIIVQYIQSRTDLKAQHLK